MLFIMKILFWFLLGFFAFWLLRRLRPSAGGGGAHSRAGERGGARMVECARCGLNFPLEESIRFDGRHYCSREHLREERMSDNPKEHDG